ncbi:uncharacterized protein TRIADDRAFT_61738 [Trichoplax adhaerens]|uniref:NB-ARC domain-containing protein n=1 Tax=Trichoplax adhaerens TaxID=10228 RepID=B3SBU4_TRIAD|nr:predicted protein [Trichoplax adhaerens]EDV19848.1 predicted protein [Trichoplax adhaerens]|eukprot:XP_002117718.1 predicted protein [Trichoplax adhaerens]
MTSSCHISRHECMDLLLSALKNIDRKSGHVFVYGMAGSGKTTIVSKAIRHLVSNINDLPYGAYWIHIGNIDQETLFETLRSLCLRLRMSADELPQKLHQVVKCLNQFLKRNRKTSESVFIFDDVWDASYFRYFQFASKSIVITRNVDPELKLNYTLVKIPNFTYAETVQILSSKGKQPMISKKHHANSHHADQYMEIYQIYLGLPLAVSIIRRIEFHDRYKWNDIKAIIDEEEISIGRHKSLNDKLDVLISCALNNLSEERRELFRLLGVFRSIRIPISMITILWNYSEHETIKLLQQLQERSLLTYYQQLDHRNILRGYCLLHNIVMDYLQKSIDEESLHISSSNSMVKALNTVLITNTELKYGYEWYRHEDDGYFYRYIIDHALQASAYKIVEILLTDIKWINATVKICKTVWGLLFNLRVIYQHVSVKESQDKLNQFYQLLQQYGIFLNQDSVDFIQFLLNWLSNDSPVYEQAYQIARTLQANSASIYYHLIYSDIEPSQQISATSLIIPEKVWNVTSRMSQANNMHSPNRGIKTVNSKRSKQDGEIIASDFDFIDNCPIVVNIIKTEDNHIKVKVRRGETLESEKSSMLDIYGPHDSSKFDVRLIGDLKGFIVIERYLCNNNCCLENLDVNHWHIITSFKDVAEIEDTHDLMITMIKRSSGRVVACFCRYNEEYSQRRLTYIDDQHAIFYYRTWKDQQFLKVFRLAHETVYEVYQTLFMKYWRDSIYACRILVSPDELDIYVTDIYDIENESIMKEELGDQDFKQLDSASLRPGGVYFLVRKGEEVVIYDEYPWLVLKANETQYINCNFPLDKVDRLWFNKLFVFIQESKVYIYNNFNFELLQIFESPVIHNSRKVKGSRNLNYFICRDRDYGYSIIKKIS